MIRRINGVNLRRPSGLTASSFSSLFSVTPGDNILNHVFVTANTFTTGDIIFLRTSFIKSGSTDSYTIRFWWNSSLSTSGATQLGVYTNPAGTRQANINRKICFLSPSSGIVINTTTSIAGSSGDFAITLSTVSITNWLTTDGYFFVTHSQVNLRVSDSVYCLYLSLEI